MPRENTCNRLGQETHNSSLPHLPPHGQFIEHLPCTLQEFTTKASKLQHRANTRAHSQSAMVAEELEVKTGHFRINHGRKRRCLGSSWLPLAREHTTTGSMKAIWARPCCGEKSRAGGSNKVQASKSNRNEAPNSAECERHRLHTGGENNRTAAVLASIGTDTR
jgi:hypothetical protein